MKYKLNILISFSGMISIFLIAGCNRSPENAKTGTDAPGIITGNQSANGARGNGNTYRMKVENKPDIIEAGKQVLFSFTPQIVGKESEPVPLENQRGYEIQLIIVNDELSWFDHRYPGLSDLGTYEQAYTFEKGGVYILYADYKPTGSTETFHMKSVAVNGFTSKSASYTQPRFSSVADKYLVNIAPGQDSKFETGKSQNLSATITLGGVTVDPNTLSDYLGGKGHMVIISVKDKEYQHIYPIVENGNLVFQTFFSKPGIYRAWIQFQMENIKHTADFVLQVEASSEGN